MHEANTALLDILVNNSVIIPLIAELSTYRPERPEVADFAVFYFIHSKYS